MQIRKILLDADGTIADFHKFIFQEFNLPDLTHEVKTWDMLYVKILQEKEGITYPLETARYIVWDFIKQRGPSFWENLPLLPWASELFSLCQSYAPTFIATSTGSPAAADSAKGKILWIQKHFPNVGYFLTDSKTEMSAPGSLLIDDNKEWCNTFSQGEGIAYCFPRPWNCSNWKIRNPLKELKEIFKKSDLPRQSYPPYHLS